MWSVASGTSASTTSRSSRKPLIFPPTFCSKNHHPDCVFFGRCVFRSQNFFSYQLVMPYPPKGRCGKAGYRQADGEFSSGREPVLEGVSPSELWLEPGFGRGRVSGRGGSCDACARFGRVQSGNRALCARGAGAPLEILSCPYPILLPRVQYQS